MLTTRPEATGGRNVNGRAFATGPGNSLTTGMPAAARRGGNHGEGELAGARAFSLTCSPAQASSTAGVRCSVGGAP